MSAASWRYHAHYDETYSLLSDNQFGGQPGHNTRPVLLVLGSSVDQPCLHSKPATLIVFDLKGVFNRVNHATPDT